jgi:hypothetical protein
MTKYTPENISVLQPNQVFVYGANEAGNHGKGAAKLALKWGAKYGKYRFSGQTYGIPTKNSQIETLPLEYIEEHIVDFLDFTKLHPELEFLVTKIGCGLAGYTEQEIGGLFAKYHIPPNVSLPIGFFREANGRG